ncbi:DEAD DEAH box helicase family protein [Cryptosporidium andersoni]|uniref:RNA helicase n=1 Tax=Cryptosporidium andersoni TaxID=117008 RepID=A0A1J4MQY5_9CRYT|nr:DEAD DEAH box helicase family protein [Cryptosporidium andersoni]
MAKGGAFHTFGFSSPIIEAIKHIGYSLPTPIQRRCFPAILAGRDVVAMARTGSGKTVAFVLPMLQRLGCKHSTIVGIRGLILSPTRELALQTYKVVRKFAIKTDIRICTLTGGSSLDRQFENLSGNPDIVIATPGRLYHHIVEAKLSLSAICMIVLDEADRLFETGLMPQIDDIMKIIPVSRQCILVSATMPTGLVSFSRAKLVEPEFIRLDSDHLISDTLKLIFIFTREDDKLATLLYLLRVTIPYNERVMVFCATKHHVEYLAKILTECNINIGSIYGNMDQDARSAQLNSFRRNKTRVMIVTDIAARGLDIPLLENVINFDYPLSAKLFVHRTGRTGRAGKMGKAFSLVTTRDLPYTVDLMLFLGLRASTLTNKTKNPNIQATDISNIGDKDNNITLESEKMGENLLKDTELNFKSINEDLCNKICKQSEYNFVKIDSLNTGDMCGESDFKSKSQPYSIDTLKIQIEQTKENEESKEMNSRDIVLIAGTPDLTMEIETIDRILTENAEIERNRRSMTAAYALYLKSRPSSSRESVKLSKQLLDECGGASRLLMTVHPDLTRDTSSRDILSNLNIEDPMLFHLKKFRPTHSKACSSNKLSIPGKNIGKVILQSAIKMEKLKISSQIGRDLSLTENLDDRNLSEILEEKINQNKELDIPKQSLAIHKRRNPCRSGQFNKSEEENKQFFIPYKVDKISDIKESALSIEASSFDINPDEDNDLRKTKYVRKWNAAKKRYQLIQKPEPGSIKKHNESGVIVRGKLKCQGQYKKWMANSNMKIQSVGELEDVKIPAKRMKKFQLSEPEFEDISKNNVLPIVGDKHKGLVEAINKGIKLTHKQTRIAKRLGLISSSKNSLEAKQYSELKTPQQILKSRKQQFKNKLKNNPLLRRKHSIISNKEFHEKNSVKITQKGRPNRSILLVRQKVNKN